MQPCVLGIVWRGQTLNWIGSRVRSNPRAPTVLVISTHAAEKAITVAIAGSKRIAPHA